MEKIDYFEGVVDSRVSPSYEKFLLVKGPGLGDISGIEISQPKFIFSAYL